MKLHTIAAAAVLTAFSASTVVVAQPAPYEINAILSVTGSSSSVGFGEANILKIIESIANKAGGINGRPIHFAISDDQSNPQLAVELTNIAIQRKASVILGSSVTSTCSAMMPLLKNGPVMYCFTPGIHPTADSYAFSSDISTVDLAKRLLRYFHERGWTRIAFITSIDATGHDIERQIDGLLAELNNAGLHIVSREHYNPQDISVAAAARAHQGL